MDPWTDLIGVPKPIKDENGNDILSYVRPSRINEELEVIVIDEINRAHKKVLNALHELVQFKTLNGMKLPKLKCVWACGNPDNDTSETYTVEKLDDALLDKFDIRVRISEKPSEDYFAGKYGKEVSRNMMSWYHNIPQGVYVSPRRIDMALESYINGGISMTFTLPSTCNPKQLQMTVLQKNLLSFIEEGNTPEELFKKSSNATEFINAFVYGSKEFKEKYAGYFMKLPNELFLATLIDQKKVINIFHDFDERRFRNYYEALRDSEFIMDDGRNTQYIDMFQEAVKLCPSAMKLLYDYHRGSKVAEKDVSVIIKNKS